MTDKKLKWHRSFSEQERECESDGNRFTVPLRVIVCVPFKTYCHPEACRDMRRTLKEIRRIHTTPRWWPDPWKTRTIRRSRKKWGLKRNAQWFCSSPKRNERRKNLGTAACSASLNTLKLWNGNTMTTKKPTTKARVLRWKRSQRTFLLLHYVFGCSKWW